MVVDRKYLNRVGKTSFTDTLRFCVPFVVPESRKCALVAISCVVCILIAKVFHLAMGVFMKLAVDSLSSTDYNVRRIGSLKAAFLFLAGRITVAFATQGFEVAQEHYSQRVIRRVTMYAFDILMNQSVSFHMNRRVGETTQIVRRGVEAIDIVLRKTLFWLIPTITEVVYVSVIFWRLGSSSIALVILVTVVAHIIYTARLTERRANIARSQRDAENSAWAHAIERMASHDFVTLFGMGNAEVQQHDILCSNVQRETFNAKRLVTFYNVSADLILQFGTFVAFVFAARDAADGTLSVGNFALAITYISALFYPLLVLAQSFGEVVAALANAEQLVALLRTSNDICDHPFAIQLPLSTPIDVPMVQFENVSFQYPRGGGVHDVSFTIERGKCTAVVGLSGAGKSTLLRLLLKLNNVQRGDVRVLGINSKYIEQTSLRRGIAFVPQDSTIFGGTLRDNVKYGREEVDDDAVFAALEQAALKKWVHSLPDALDTVVGERGVQLSGGERQRIGIARALLRDVPIFVFDEATSALSSLDEETIQQSMRLLLKEKATLIVAHRLSTIKHADEILVMEHGRIVERGTHLDLLNSEGLYARMWKVQSGNDTTE